MVYMAMDYALIFHAALVLLVPLLSLKDDKRTSTSRFLYWLFCLEHPPTGAQVDPTSLTSNKPV